MKEISLKELIVIFKNLNGVEILEENIDNASESDKKFLYDLVSFIVVKTVEEVYKNLTVVDTLFGPEILKPSLEEIRKSLKHG